MQKLKTSRVALRRFCLAGVALALFLSGGASPGAQEMPDNEGFLVGVLLKSWALREQAIADIQTNEREIQANQQLIQEAEKRMSNALETYNHQAAMAAKAPLEKARADGKKLKQARVRLELFKKRAEASYAAVKDLIVSDQGKGPNFLIRGLVSLHSGKAKILKKDGRLVALDGQRPEFLEPGDDLLTSAVSSGEARVLGGRASVLLGEQSRLKLEEEGPQEQVIRLLQGKIRCAVDRADDFADMLQDSARHLEADQKLKEAVARTGDRAKGLADKKFTVRTPNACCSVTGTEFTVGLMGGEETEIAVLEGAVEVGDAECAKQVLVEHGFRVAVTKAGISEPQKFSDINKWWEK